MTYFIEKGQTHEIAGGTAMPIKHPFNHSFRRPIFYMAPLKK